MGIKGGRYIKNNVGWISDSVIRQVLEKWWITLSPIHPTKAKNA